MNINKIIKENLIVDTIIFQRNGNIKVKEHYFYTIGKSPDTVAENVIKQMDKIGIDIEIIEKTNHYNSWPKDSWFEVIFKFK